MALYEEHQPEAQDSGIAEGEEIPRGYQGNEALSQYAEHGRAAYPGYGAGYPGAGNGFAGASYGGPERGAMHELRPLTLGEILDRTFTLYRSRFWLFAGISSLAAVVQVVAAGAQMIGMRGMMRMPAVGTTPAQLPGVLAHSGLAILVGYAVGLIYLLAASVTQAGTAWALSEVYLGREATVGSAMRVAGGRWWEFIAIAIWQAFSLLWLPIVIGGLCAGLAAMMVARGGGAVVVGVIAFLAIFGVIGGFVFGVFRYLTNSLAIPAAVIEGMPVRPAMRRSKGLSRGTLGRVFLVLLVVWGLYLVAGMLQAPLSLLWLRAPAESHVLAQAALLLIGFVSHTLVAPVMMIGLTLVYFDQRVRTEAFDLVMLMGEADDTAGREPGAAAARMSDASLR